MDRVAAEIAQNNYMVFLQNMEEIFVGFEIPKDSWVENVVVIVVANFVIMVKMFAKNEASAICHLQ